MRHGLSYSKTYRSWVNMKNRCTNPKCDKFSAYGGRGISFDPRWSEFKNFYSDMGDRPDNMTLDRVDPNGEYSKQNCRWVSWSVQYKNKRPRKEWNFSGGAGEPLGKAIEFNGEVKSISGWSRKLRIPFMTLSKRIRRWGVDKALTTPVDTKCRNRYAKKGGTFHGEESKR